MHYTWSKDDDKRRLLLEFEEGEDYLTQDESEIDMEDTDGGIEQ